MKKKLPLPFFYDAGKHYQRFDVDYGIVFDAAEDYAKVNEVPISATDKIKVLLMPIDMQVTFCNEDHVELPVKGAAQDCRRTAEFIYRNLDRITTISPTMDTHSSMQIFHRPMLVDRYGKCPPAHTVITVKDVEVGRWSFNPKVATTLFNGDLKWCNDYLLYYTKKLAELGRPPLIIWPFHGLAGSQGHALMPILEEACRFHEFARVSPIDWVQKGASLLRESYSVFKPSVTTTHDGQREYNASIHLFNHFLSHDMIIIPGEASSHCVADSISDLLEYIQKSGSAMAKVLARKVYILEDCMSPVVIVPGDPNLDFTPFATAALKRFKDAGMNVVKSTDPIEYWPYSPFAEDKEC
jgi:nicotinamidase-related amidase